MSRTQPGNEGDHDKEVRKTEGLNTQKIIKELDTAGKTRHRWTESTNKQN